MTAQVPVAAAAVLAVAAALAIGGWLAALPQAENDACVASAPEGTAIRASRSLWPPGTRCRYDLPDGSVRSERHG